MRRHRKKIVVAPPCSCPSCRLRASWSSEEREEFDRKDKSAEIFELTGCPEANMADEMDLAAEANDAHQEVVLEEARRKAQAIPKGEPGECKSCGEFYARLVRGHCARCRDEFHLL